MDSSSIAECCEGMRDGREMMKSIDLRSERREKKEGKKERVECRLDKGNYFSLTGRSLFGPVPLRLSGLLLLTFFLLFLSLPIHMSTCTSWCAFSRKEIEAGGRQQREAESKHDSKNPPAVVRYDEGD